MKVHHMNPEEAVKAHLDLTAHLSIAMGQGTFQLADEGFLEPIHDLKIALEKYHLTEDVFLIPCNGQTLYYQQ